MAAHPRDKGCSWLSLATLGSPAPPLPPATPPLPTETKAKLHTREEHIPSYGHGKFAKNKIIRREVATSSPCAYIPVHSGLFSMRILQQQECPMTWWGIVSVRVSREMELIGRVCVDIYVCINTPHTHTHAHTHTGADVAVFSLRHPGGRIPFLLRAPHSSLSSPSPDWTRPTRVMKGNLLYSTSTDLNVNCL